MSYSKLLRHLFDHVLAINMRSWLPNAAPH